MSDKETNPHERFPHKKFGDAYTAGADPRGPGDTGSGPARSLRRPHSGRSGHKAPFGPGANGTYREYWARPKAGKGDCGWRTDQGEERVEKGTRAVPDQALRPPTSTPAGGHQQSTRTLPRHFRHL